MTIRGKVVLKKGKEHAVKRFHPWIFSGAIHSLTGTVQDGHWVEVADIHGEVLGFGHYQNGSIAVRLLCFGSAVPPIDFWHQRIQQALHLRRSANLPSPATNAFRLVHGEGDSLSGLIIDYYDGVAVMQAHSPGMHLDRHDITLALQTALSPQLKAVYYKSQNTLPSKNDAERFDEYLFGSDDVPKIISENTHQFYVDWIEGQKTGFFLDQRENRKLLAEYCNGKSVLNTFCYSGGFSIYALAARAVLVHSVDASEKAVTLARRNIALNGFNSELHSAYAMDVFDFLKDKQDQYDVIVLDPPAFAKHREARHQAVKGYQRLNAAAMRVIKSGGVLFTFSCSQVVDKELFYHTMVSAAIQARRQIKVLHQLSQPADHPVSIFHPEGSYLKGLVLYVA